MGTARSSMPSRLRQLLSGEGSIGPSIRLDSDPPPDIKVFIDKVIQSPLQDIAIPLSGFHWEYNKGNFHHWRPLFLHFDTYFKTYVSCRNDLLLTDRIIEDDNPLPKHAILHILRVMQIILENCPNKSSFEGLEHFKLLMASTDPEIVIAALETLSALVKISASKIHRSGKLIGCGSVNGYLLSLAQGWGSKEEGLGLYSCVVANEKRQEEGLSLFPLDLENNSDKSQYRIGSSLYFELHGHSVREVGDNVGKSSPTSSKVIYMPDLHLRKEDDLLLMKQCIEHYDVSPALRFSLLTRIRYAHAFRSSRTCRLYSRICLLAFIVLVQSNDAQDELTTFFANEPEYTNELIRIVRSEEPIPGTIRTLAMQALGAQLAMYSASHDRARILSGSSISFAMGNRMILLNVLQRAVMSLKGSNDPSSVSFVEAFLHFYLLHIVSSSSSGSNVRGSGMVPTFLPLLEDSEPSHMHIVYLAVKALQKLMDYSSSAVTLLRELGGVELLSQRLQTEVHCVLGLVAERYNAMAIGDSSRLYDDQLCHKRLIKVLLKALGSATYTPSNSNRPQNTNESSLPSTLSLIYRNADRFGGDIYCSAVTVMSDIIHKDPTYLSTLLEMGLPEAFISSVVAGVLPSAKAITCIPNGLGAICLNVKGLEAVRESSALRFLVDVFTSKNYVLAMNEGIVQFANAFEELVRHVSSLRSTGVDIIIEIINKISSFGDSSSSGTSEKVDASSMEMDSEGKGVESHSCVVSSVGLGPACVSDDQFMQLCIFHLMVLLHRTMEISETCRLFVEKAGIEALLKLLLRPSIAQSSEGISIALHSTIVFKGFTTHHASSLARSFCSALREQLKKALSGLGAASGSFLLDPKVTPNGEIFPSLFLVEFLLFLAASKDTRWINALLAELGNGSKDVLEDIGRVHREILWQMALQEDAKVEVGDEMPSSASETQDVELNTNETEEQRYNSFRQFLDPLLRRRTSGLSIESQFFDLISLYRDLGRAGTGFQPISVTENSSGSNGAGASAGSTVKEHDKQKSYYNSCCDMVKSLSFHITYLFQELGKALLSPSRRRDDAVNVSPSSKSVAQTFASIALDHLNFGGHVSTPEASVSMKCHYFGKVIDFIDGVMLDRPDSCNPVLLNCLYGRGVIQAVLTTFEATSQLLFAVNRPPSSPMETDDGKTTGEERDDGDHAWIYGPLASYGTLMDHLVTSSFILSQSTKHLLVQPLTEWDVSFPRDPETVVKLLQSMVLKAVLPVWAHPGFTDCSYDFISALISIIKHVYSGVEVKNVSSSSARVTGPPPNESSISTIVEMGFSRSRAEEALRQVGSNSVELAMEWLFSHPEEVQEDDELARALAMSLGNSESDRKQDVGGDDGLQIEQEIVQLPPVEELLYTCIKLLQMKEPLAFPVRDLLVLICSQNNGEHRSTVISFILDQVKSCNPFVSGRNNKLLSALFHVLALILHEDTGSREVASKAGMIRLVTDVLSQWDYGQASKEKDQVPKWVTTGFLAIDRVLQVDHRLNSDVVEHLKKDEKSHQIEINVDDEKKNKVESGYSLVNYIDINDQKRLIEIACNCIQSQLPSGMMHAILQLCSTLTRNHSVALSFLDAGGISSLLSLPTSSLFPGFDNVAASIIRHVLEDPQTLQQAMESEIKHTLATLANRHSNPRITPRNFLMNLNSVISRDPVVFMQSARSLCQVEMVNERPYIVLIKDKEKDKCKDKEKEKEKEKEKDKDKSSTGVEDRLMVSGVNQASLASGQVKSHEINTKGMKSHRKPPQSFVNVIELLLESIIVFVPPPKDAAGDSSRDSESTDMEIDVNSIKGKGKAVATVSGEKEASCPDASASLAKIVFILKLLTEILLMYSSSVHVLLRRDAEMSSSRGPLQKTYGGGIFRHILHKFFPLSRNSKGEKKSDGDWRQKLATRANQFLVVSCVRSPEARKRIFAEINGIFCEFVDLFSGARNSGNDIQSYVDLLIDVLTARTPTGSHISAEASVTFIDAGLVKSFTRMLDALDLDNAESPKTVTGIIKVLEVVTKEHVHSSDSSLTKDENANKTSNRNQSERTDNASGSSQPVEMASQSNNNATTVENLNAAQNFVGSEVVTDDMEHHQDIDSSFGPVAEADYMQETPEDGRGLESDIGSMGIEFEIQPHVQENIDDDEDEEMSGDEGDEVDEADNDNEDDDDEEDNDLEEDDGHHLPHHDTDQDDHDIDDDDEFDDEVLVEEDEEDDDDEDRVRFEDGLNGLNVLDHLEVFRDHRFPDDTLHVMPVEVFGSRRQGWTTSIYSLLGRAGDRAAPAQHPLLSGPPTAHTSSRRQPGVAAVDRDAQSAPSRLDTIFRSLRSSRHGHRLNLWADDNQQSSGSSSSALPQGLEELLVSQLRGRATEKAPDQSGTVMENQTQVEGVQSQEAVARGGLSDDYTVNNTNSESRPTPSVQVTSDNADGRQTVVNSLRANDVTSTNTQAVEMQYEHNDVAVRDVEAVSQESGGSGATLGESLRSLDVEIGSVDGHDDGGERHGSVDRLSAGDTQRTRRTNTTAVTGRDVSLHSVTEVSENSGAEADQEAPSVEQQPNNDAGSGSIDPAFLDALPEELRAEVLSAQQSQAAQPSTTEQHNAGDIDPEFLAALPPDIRAEVLAQQQAQRLHPSQELEGQPVEMDTVSIIATFPSELREEVLLTSSDAVLANLTPALVAEANMLRERLAHRYHNRALFGMYPRSRRGEPSRRGEGALSTRDRSEGIGSRRPIGSRVIEAEGAPLVNTEALQAVIRVLRIVQPLYKGSLQRLLLNLCAHNETRIELVKILMNMLMLDKRKAGYYSCTTEPLYRLYTSQTNVAYSRPQQFDGIPPLVSRRVLETLTYLASNHVYVAKILLQFRLLLPSLHPTDFSGQDRGKAAVTFVEYELEKKQHEQGDLSIALLLSLLNQPLYLRSIAHLEQLLSLLEVIIDNAERGSGATTKPEEGGTDPQSRISDSRIETENRNVASVVAGSSVKTLDSFKPQSSGKDLECDGQSVLLNLPQADLCLLCSLLAREGLSDSAYTHVANVLKKLVAIAPSHCHLFITELANAVQNLTKLAMDELRMFGEAVKALLGTTSSDGSAILRVLQALSLLIGTLIDKEKQQEGSSGDNVAISHVLRINTALEPLWVELSTCISKIESYSDSISSTATPSRSTFSPHAGSVQPLPAGAQNILPYIESFFVTCEKLHPAQPGSNHDFGSTIVSDEDASTAAGQSRSPPPATKVDEKDAAFVKFTEKNKKLLNAFIRQNPGLLEKSFSLMLKVPRFVDFDNKRAYFRSKIKHLHDHQHSPLRISVRRAYILEDSYNQLRMRSTQELKGRLTVHFQGEEGIDAGGLTREWYQVLSRVIFDKGALLFTTVGNESTFQPNPNSVYQTEHLSYFKFVGRVVGKALFDGQLLDVYFTRSFYKHILNSKVTYHDIEAIDPDYYKNLKWLLENEISDDLDLTFSLDADEEKLILYERAEVTDHELIPGGRNIKVTEENKHQYVDLVVEHRLTTAIRPQINAFLDGFNELITRDLISIFNDRELELLISGLPDIDLDDLRANTEYSGYGPASPVIQWFWEVVHGFSKEDKARLLQFVTGTSKVPLEGFSALQGISGSQKFQIHKAYGSSSRLPSAHTCFNQLDLPEYPSKEHLKERLLLAIHEGSQGFGFG